MVLCAQFPGTGVVRVAVVGVVWLWSSSGGVVLGGGGSEVCGWPVWVGGVVELVVLVGGVGFVRGCGWRVVPWCEWVVFGGWLGGLPCIGMHDRRVCGSRSGGARTCGRSQWLWRGRLGQGRRG